MSPRYRARSIFTPATLTCLAALHSGACAGPVSAGAAQSAVTSNAAARPNPSALQARTVARHGFVLEQGRHQGVAVTRDGGLTLAVDPQDAHLSSLANEYRMEHLAEHHGAFRQLFVGCERGTRWEELTWDASTPPKTSVTVLVRAAATSAELASSAPQGPLAASPAKLGESAHSGVLEVELVLRSTDAHALPEVHGISASFRCDSP